MRKRPTGCNFPAPLTALATARRFEEKCPRRGGDPGPGRKRQARLPPLPRGRASPAYGHQCIGGYSSGSMPGTARRIRRRDPRRSGHRNLFQRKRGLYPPRQDKEETTGRHRKNMAIRRALRVLQYPISPSPPELQTACGTQPRAVANDPTPPVYIFSCSVLAMMSSCTLGSCTTK